MMFTRIRQPKLRAARANAGNGLVPRRPARTGVDTIKIGPRLYFFPIRLYPHT